jgi:hypothetical protein
LGTRRCPFILSEEDKIISKKLELGIALESALSRLDFVIDLSQFLSRMGIQLPEEREVKGGRNDE